MLKKRIVNLFFVLLVTAIAVPDIFIHIPLPVYAGIIIAYTGILAWASADIRSGWYIRTYCSGDMKKRSLALTFDDGPDKEITPALLDLLRKENVKAAFFCTGRKAGENPDIIARIDREGHIIGNHSFTHHFFFDLFSSSGMAAEMQKTEDVIFGIINKKTRFFRPPYGVTNPPLAKAVELKSYKAIGWSLRTKDTVIKDEHRLLERIEKKISPGDIVLFHDSMKNTVDVTGKFIKYARENGFEFIRPDHHLGLEAYE